MRIPIKNNKRNIEIPIFWQVLEFLSFLKAETQA